MTPTARPRHVLRELLTQQLAWSAAGPGEVEHGTVAVPLDYADPRGERLTLALSRFRARDPGRRRGVLLAVNGGPGGYFGLGRRFASALSGSPLADRYDIIGFDPRGTGDSTPLLGEVTGTAAPFDSRPPDGDFATIAEDFRRREEGNRRAGGDRRPHFSTRNVARDLDVVRRALGEERINFLGYTYGTYLGAVYGSMFPRRLDRSVLDSCVHPDWTWRQQFMAQARASRANVDRWAAWVADRHDRYGLGRAAPLVRAAADAVLEGLVGEPDSRTLRSKLDGALGSRSADRARWADLAELLLDIRAHGHPAARRGLADERVWPPADADGSVRCGVLDAVSLEKEWPSDPEVYFADMRHFREHYPYGYGVHRAQPWVGAFRSFAAPEAPTELVRRRYPAGLIVHADGDPIDHYDGAPVMAQRLGHRLVTVTDSGQHEIYRFAGNAAVDAVVERYLLDGVLPERDPALPGTVARPDVPADAAARPVAEAAR
ncbi:protease [Pilimelia anulata]|uniref:Protease n=1 Tax=Pilimelia anulata TaxID=53371 RepID=A0A8J3BA94_9ACTN|nr:alpha/beta fold hydrolase [Pilimelia anulata]GGJ96565.1 protease [Pilimelia anulata]